MQNTIVKEFENRGDVTVLVWDQGGSHGETRAWLETFWNNYYLRGSVLFDEIGQIAGQVYNQPSTGLPFGRGFIIDRRQRVVLPYFGHQPQMAIEKIHQALDETLAADQDFLSVSTGGSVDFDLQAGVTHAGRNYLLLGTMSGTEPGLPLPGGQATLPLTWDSFTSFVLAKLNTPLFTGFLGALDEYGLAEAKIDAPPVNPGKIGKSMHFAYILEGEPWDFASNPVPITFVP